MTVVVTLLVALVVLHVAVRRRGAVRPLGFVPNVALPEDEVVTAHVVHLAEWVPDHHTHLDEVHAA